MAGSSAPSGSGVEKYFGLELLFHSCKDNLRSKNDALVVLLHYLFVRNGKRSVGAGEEWTKPSQSTELLPEGWNADEAIYSLRYVSTTGNDRYLLTVVRADGFLLVNVLNIRKERTASTNFSVDKHVTNDYKDFSKAYKDLDVAVSKVTEDIISVMDTIDSSTEAASSRPSRNVSQESNPLHIPSRQPGIEWQSHQDLVRVGQRDLNPFYPPGVGGGMLMDPRQMPRPHHSDPGVGFPGLPRGAVPPGARFDPFSPPNPNNPGVPRGIGPNPDHLPPPPDYDDMFS
ncbi:proteasome inhibitor PI31 subunit-like [Ornithodoros turicata]|uniref:proteasome inhibitor PI31 subunit-like n=1 Tax=Ornithodoros turicata TaxID=34597 RepID=UPI0031398E1A